MKLTDCDSCLVYGTDKKPLSRARVEEVKENVLRLFFLSPRLRNARLKTIVDFYDRQHVRVRGLCEVILKKNPAYFETAEPWMADCTILKIYEVLQRQKDLRVDVHISLEFVRSDGKYFTGTIQDISAGGMYVITAHKLDMEQKFSFIYTFKHEKRIVDVKVVRIKEMGGGYGYGYGCRFIGLSPDTEADIRSFVYMNQIQKRLDKKKKTEGAEDEFLL